MPLKVHATANVKAITEKLKKEPTATAVVGVAKTEGDPSLTEIMEWLERGWVQKITHKQSYYFYKNFDVNLVVGHTLVLPPRPFFRGTLLENGDKWKTMLAKLVVDNDFSTKQAGEYSDPRSRGLTLAVRKTSTRWQHFFMPNSGEESRNLVCLGFQDGHCEYT